MLSVLINEVSQHLVSAGVITIPQDEEVMSPTTSKEKAKKLLLALEGPIKAGYLKALTELLNVMDKCGNDASKQLSSEINTELSSRRKQTSKYIDGMHMSQ